MDRRSFLAGSAAGLAGAALAALRGRVPDRKLCERIARDLS